MQSPEFAKLAVGVQTLQVGRKCDEGEGEPKIFAESCGDGFLAEKGELLEGGVVLGMSAGALSGCIRERVCTYRERVRE